MLRQASRSSENDGAEYDYGDVLSKVENLEQSIIQHIRTSGVRKPRETALIDEVMDLRRERRKFSADVQNHIKSLEKQNMHLSDELRVLKERLDSEVEKAQVQSRTLPEQREADRLQFEERLKRELATQEEKLKFMEKINIAKVRNKFEERMKEMEIRANEMIDEKARAELKDARSIALGLVEKAKIELEKRCNEKIAE
jgi:DNA anti-recombination protein RmuC